MQCIRDQSSPLFQKKRFTTNDFSAEQFLEDQFTLYGTSSGQLFLYNYKRFQATLVAILDEEKICSIVSYNREAFLGTGSGNIYVVNLINHTCGLIGRLKSPVVKVYIFGDGVNRMIYAATQSGRVSAFQYVVARGSFSSLGLNSTYEHPKVLQSTFTKIRLLDGQYQKELINPQDDNQESSNSQDVQSTPSQLNLLALDQSIQIMPVWTQRFKNAKPTFLHGCEDILGFCSEDGVLRFFSMMNFSKLMEFQCTGIYPTCCCVHKRIIKGQEFPFCVAGYSNGDIYTIDLANSSVTKNEFSVELHESIQAIFCKKELLFTSDLEKLYVFTTSHDLVAVHKFKIPNPVKQEYGESDENVILSVAYHNGMCARIVYENERFNQILITK